MSPIVSLNDSDAGKPGIVEVDRLQSYSCSADLLCRITTGQYEARRVAFELNDPIVDSNHPSHENFPAGTTAVVGLDAHTIAPLSSHAAATAGTTAASRPG